MEANWKADFSVEITPKALDQIRETIKSNGEGEHAIIIADTHCCGGILNVEVHPLMKARQDPNLLELNSGEESQYGIPVWIEQMAVREQSVPNQILLDFNPFARPPQLEVKNGRFEKAYE